MRARLGPAARAVTQFGPTVTSMFDGTKPFTTPGKAVGRLRGWIGVSFSACAGGVTAVTNTAANASAIAVVRRLRMYGIVT